MKLVVYVLSKPDLLQSLLTAFTEIKVKGATILDSTGMGRELLDNEEISIFGSLRAILNSNARQTKTLFLVTEDEQVQKIIATIEKVVGKLEGPDSGIVFTLPVDYIKGYKK